MERQGCRFIIIKKGDPYLKDDKIPLGQTEILIGRSSKVDRPPIAFDSLYISRRHALLSWDGETYRISDLASKHGTLVNGTEIEPDKPHRLNSGDEIGLARGIATMTYSIFDDFDDRTITMTRISIAEPGAITVNLDRREVYVEGTPLSFSGKEKDLLLLLYRCRNRAVGYDEIKRELWSERAVNGIETPDVGNDEVTTLVYRLRKRLGKHGDKVVTVARFGVILNA